MVIEDSLKALMKVLYDGCRKADQYDRVHNPDLVTNLPFDDYFRSDLMIYAVYIIFANGKVTAKEIEMFSYIFDTKVTEKNLKEMHQITLMDKKFCEHPPVSLVRFATRDLMQHNVKGISGTVVGLYDALGKLFLACDTDDIFEYEGIEAFHAYMRVLYDFMAQNVPEIVIPRFDAECGSVYNTIARKQSIFDPDDEDDKDLLGDTNDIEKFMSENGYNDAKDSGKVNYTKPKAVKEKEKTLDDLLNELNGLVGLELVKDDVNSLINFIQVMKMREKRGMRHIPITLHLVFSGNPGTGKTTVARLLAKIYHKLGLISSGQLIEVDRADLVGGYVGQTAIKTKEVIQRAMGGVLFIDEAYSLTSSKDSSDYGQEAIDTILKAMEDNRDNFVVIVAGYTKLMERFVNSNPGLRSRFNKFLHFEDYKPDELQDIFIKMCNDNGYTLNKDAKDYAERYFINLYRCRGENFANAREVRNFFEKAMTRQANRVALFSDISDKELLELMVEDLTN